MNRSYIIEQNEEVFGIVSLDSEGFRFFCSDRRYHQFEERVFASPKKAMVALSNFAAQKKIKTFLLRGIVAGQ